MRKIARQLATKISSRRFLSLEKKHLEIIEDKSIIVKYKDNSKEKKSSFLYDLYNMKDIRQKQTLLQNIVKKMKQKIYYLKD